MMVLQRNCQSKDDDLGVHDIEDGGEYGWDFKDNVFGTTLFFCDMSWESVHQFHFNAYEFGRDFTRCGDTGCAWIISAEGIYGSNKQTGYWEFMYNWPTN